MTRPITAKKWHLDNGLTVIHEYSEAAPIVSLQVGVKIGSAHEQDHQSGLCHLIEHMVFKGSTSFAAGEMATRVEASGGEFNAFTSLDQTVYYINLPASEAALGLKILKEMVFDATMSIDELEREKEVVVEEIKRGQDSPQRVLGESLFGICYPDHSYGRPVIGTEGLVRGYSQQQLVSFYKTYYVPENMILGVCGKITEEELRSHLSALFQDVRGMTPHITLGMPTHPRAEKRVVVKSMDIANPIFEIAFPVPEFGHADVAALDVLSHLLGESETSLLEQNIKEKKRLVHAIYSSCYTPRYAGQFFIGGQCEMKNIPGAVNAIHTEIETARHTLFEAQKIERAKSLARSQWIYEKETCEGTARKWMIYETTLGDFLYDVKYMEAVERLTAHDLRTAAQTYLNPARARMVIITPKNEKLKWGETVFGSPKKSEIKSNKALSKKEHTALYRLSNGLRVVVRENHRLPLVSIKLATSGGLRHESPSNNGISQLFANTLAKGTQSLSHVEVSEKCEWFSGHLSGYSGRNSVGLSFGFVSDYLEQAIPLMADVWLNPAFDKEHVAKELALQKEAIRNMLDNPGQVSFRNALSRLFKGHPYERSLLGTPQSLKTLSQQALKKYHRAHLNPADTIIAASGDVEANELIAQLEKAFGSLKKSAVKKSAKIKIKGPKNVVSFFEEKHRKQAHVVVAFLATSLYAPERSALEVLNNILSGQGGKLFLELRDKMSLAYSVGSTLIEGVDTGFFGVHIGTDPNKVEKAIRAIETELEKIRSIGVTREDLERAQRYIIGNHAIEHQKNSAIAMQLCLNELYGLGYDEFFDYENRIRAVSLQDVQNAAQKYITLDRCIISVVGPKGCWDITP